MSSDHPIESSLVPTTTEQEMLSAVSYLYGEVPGLINLPDEVLEQGVHATLNYLIPGSTGIVTGGYSPKETLLRLGNRIQTVLTFDKLSRLELGHIFWFIRHEKSWNKLTGGHAYKSFQEFIRCNDFPLEYSDIEEYLQFYELFCQCVNAHLSPLPLLAPKKFSLYKRRLIQEQIEGVDGKVDTLISNLGEEDPGLKEAVQAVRSSVVEEIFHIVETPESDLQQQENERRYPPAEEEMKPLSLYVQMHLQQGALICDHALIPLTMDAFQAWKAGYMKRRVQIQGVPDAMTMEELEQFLQDHDLFVEEPPTIDAEEGILL